MNEPQKPFSLAEFFADKILSKHNQFVSVRVVGVSGSGKSWATITLCYEVAKILSKRTGKPIKTFFDFDDQHMSVMNEETLKSVMSNPIKNSILFLDDIGTVLNARRFMSKDNIEFNDIFQTFRPQNNLVIMTMQDSSLVDKVARILCHFEIEMTMPLMDKGLTVGRCQEIRLDHKTGQIYYPYIKDKDGNKIRQIVFNAPDKEITDRYEIVRTEMLNRLKEHEGENESPVYSDKKITLEILLEPDILQVYEKYASIGETINFAKMAEEVSKINRFKKECYPGVIKKVLKKYNFYINN